MDGKRIQTDAHSRIEFDEDAIAPLRESFQGELIRPGDADYDQNRRVWNGMIDKRPALIARCWGAADVMAAIDFAVKRGLPLSVRGGGHNVAGRAVCNGGLVLDLSPMRAVRVDPVNRIVQVQGGATLTDVDHETQPFGLAVPLGLVGVAGVAGLALHGGMGWLTRKYGLTLDNLIAADVVTAEGKLLRASDTEHPDLFWAIRGGGGNFGVVTTFEFLAYPVGPDVWFAAILYPISQAKRIMKSLYNFMIDAPEDLGLLVTLWNAPNDASIPPEHRGQPVVAVIGCYLGPFEEGEELIRPLREITEPVADLSGPRRYLDVQRFFDADYPDGMFYYWKSAYLKRLDDQVIDTLIRHAGTRPSPLTSLELWFLGGAMTRIPVDKTAYSRRDARFALAIESNWTDPEQSDANVAWSREVFNDLQRFTRGVYLNFPGFIENRDMLLHDAYGPNLDRLREIKAHYDPKNLFQGLLNIAPAK